MKLTKVHLLALAFVAGVLPVAASADGWFSRAGETKEVTLNDLLKSPREYMDVEVTIKVYFDATGSNFNPYFTRFNEEAWGNFSAWPIDARLYDKRDFPRPYPFFFASKLDKSWKKVKGVDHLRVIKVTGVVRDVFQGQPWIEVLSWSSSSGGLSESDVRDVINADANFVAGRYKDAARLYERADSSNLPDGVRADLQRRLGDAYFRAGKYGDAKDAFETGLRHAPDNAVLKQGLEASEVGRQHDKAARSGKAVDGEVPDVAPVEQPVVESNGVDEVIRLLEDPAKVQADVVAWRAELEQRATAVRGGERPEATPVAGTTKTTEEPAHVAPEEVVEPAVEEDEGCAEGCSEPVTRPESVPAPVATPKPVVTPEPVATPKPVEQPVVTPAPVETPVSVGEGGCGGSCGEQACGWTETTEVPVDETVSWQGDDRVVWVSGQMIRLPRLPFFGAEDVTDDDLRAIIEEVVQSPESDE